MMINYEADFYASGSSDPVAVQFVPRDNADYKLTAPETSDKG